MEDGQFRALADHAPVALALCDMEGNLVYVNQAYADLIGWTINETLRLSYWNITPRSFEPQEAEQLQRLQSQRCYGPYEKLYIHKRGHLIPVSLSGSVVEVDGTPYIWSAVLPRERPSHRRLIESAPVGLALCRMDGQLVAVNQAFADIIGRTIQETLALTYWRLTPSKYEKDEAEQLDRIKRDGAYGPYRKEYIHRDGHLVPVELVGTRLRIDEEEYVWSVVLTPTIEEGGVVKEIEAGLVMGVVGIDDATAAKVFGPYLMRSSEEPIRPIDPA